MREAEAERQVIEHEVKLSSKLGEIKEENKRKYAEKYQDLSTLKLMHEDKL